MVDTVGNDLAFEIGSDDDIFDQELQYLWFASDGEAFYMPLWMPAFARLVVWIVSIYRVKRKQSELGLKEGDVS